MSELKPGAKFCGWPPGIYSKGFTGKLIEIVGEGWQKFVVERDGDQKRIEVQTATLEAA